MCLLCDLGRGCLASANGPDRLVGNDDLAPVRDAICDGVELGFEDVIGGSALPVLQLLSNTNNRH